MQILHVIDRLSGGGPTRSMLALAKLQRRAGLPHRHRALVLQAPVYPIARALAIQAGVELIMEPDDDALWQAAAAADIVLLNFWNNPLIYEFLRRSLPPMRLLVWMQVVGNTAPQIITRTLVDFADECVVTTPASLALPAFERAPPPPMIFGIADFDRLTAVQQPHDGFNVTYIGSLNFAKLHPDFIPMSAAIQVPEARFIVCGEQPDMLKAQASALGAAHRFDFRGFVEGIGPVLALSDVFGYPLCVDTYATSEKSLQEAQWMGVPPVVFPYGGIAHLVEHGVSGLIVHTADEYRASIEWLHDNPGERLRLAEGAKVWARARFDGTTLARQFDTVFGAMMETPKRERAWPHREDATPSGHFIESLGEAGAAFAVSKTASDPGVQAAADRRIAASSLLLANGEGGILHYRNTYPDDPYLRYWTTLVLIGQGRHEAARREWAAAQACGLPDPARRVVILEGLR